MTLKPHKHKDAIVAYANGHEIEARICSSEPWKLCDWPAFNESHQYRVYDKFRELKEAHASGKKIQHKMYLFNPETFVTTIRWDTLNDPQFDGNVSEYRIIPDEIDAARVAYESGHTVVMQYDGGQLTFTPPTNPHNDTKFPPYYKSVPDGATFQILPKKRKHVHAEAMMEYAKDAMETDTPWERWEYRWPYYDLNLTWKNLLTHPLWDPKAIYRKKEAK